MNKLIISGVFFSMLLVNLTGCAQQKAQDSQAAIEQSKSLKTVEEQVKYLVSQANSFVSSKEFDQAISTGKYILANLDSNSQEAKSIIEKATAEMKKMAQGAVNDVKNKLGTLGK